MKYSILIFLSLFIVSCGDASDIVIPKGFERLGGEGASHFVYVDKKYLDNRKVQRAAGKQICEKYKNTEYCEVYMWKNRSKVVKQLPVILDLERVGRYTLKDGKIRLKVLR